MCCYLLITIELVFLIIAIQNKFFLGRIVYFGDKGDHYPDDHKYFNLLTDLEYSLWLLMFLWIILSLIIVVIKRIDLAKVYCKIGILGFILGILFFIIDPFGVIKYWVD